MRSKILYDKVAETTLVICRALEHVTSDVHHLGIDDWLFFFFEARCGGGCSLHANVPGFCPLGFMWVPLPHGSFRSQAF